MGRAQYHLCVSRITWRQNWKANLLDSNNLISRQSKEVLQLLEEFKHAFPQSSTDYSRPTLIEHQIDTGEARPKRQAPRRIPHALREEISTQIHSMLDHGIILPSRSPWASPIVSVPKKDGGTRLCVNYRQLNEVTLKDAYPTADTLEALSGAKYFSTMDLLSGYLQGSSKWGKIFFHHGSGYLQL